MINNFCYSFLKEPIFKGRTVWYFFLLPFMKQNFCSENLRYNEGFFHKKTLSFLVTGFFIFGQKY
ncbi:MAG: hypothetical protein CL555_06605 [Algoriphagus sp.]|nr:hypothetical protein [Algoriphagus sp.]